MYVHICVHIYMIFNIEIFCFIFSFLFLKMLSCNSIDDSIGDGD